jgi:hypothetical protein
MRFVFFVCCLFVGLGAVGQKQFKVGDKMLNAASVQREFYYEVVGKDSAVVKLNDSAVSYATADSAVCMRMNYVVGGGLPTKEVALRNEKRQLLKLTHYVGDNVINESSWEYEAGGLRKISMVEDDKSKGVVRKEGYEYSNDKINGDQIITVTKYNGGKVEGYLKQYFDKGGRKYKEVQIADNKKDVVHTETFYYAENGKLRSRSIYFNEFKVTKDFVESGGDEPEKCTKNFALALSDKPTSANKDAVLRTFINKNKALMTDKDCNFYDYTFKSPGCDINLRNSPKSGAKQATIIIREH